MAAGSITFTKALEITALEAGEALRWAACLSPCTRKQQAMIHLVCGLVLRKLETKEDVDGKTFTHTSNDVLRPLAGFEKTITKLKLHDIYFTELVFVTPKKYEVSRIDGALHLVVATKIGELTFPFFDAEGKSVAANLIKENLPRISEFVDKD